MTIVNNILALDVGEKRVGVAVVRGGTTIPVIVTTLERQADDFWQQLETVLSENSAHEVVIGLPRGLDGQETPQTGYARSFAEQMIERFGVIVHFQDEALTSVEAEKILKASGKPYAKGDIDSLAASLILGDFVNGASA